jgi:hypothetical protein
MKWSYWPFCSIKKDGVTGFVYDETKGRRIVYVGNLLSFLRKEIKIETLEKIEYANSHDMVADGWEVD